jgi:hypothetical protein
MKKITKTKTTIFDAYQCVFCDAWDETESGVKEYEPTCPARLKCKHEEFAYEYEIQNYGYFDSEKLIITKYCRNCYEKFDTVDVDLNVENLSKLYNEQDGPEKSDT